MNTLEQIRQARERLSVIESELNSLKIRAEILRKELEQLESSLEKEAE